MPDHEIKLDELSGVWWIDCPKSDGELLPLAAKPKFCPICGEHFVVIKDGEQVEIFPPPET